MDINKKRFTISIAKKLLYILKEELFLQAHFRDG